MSTFPRTPQPRDHRAVIVIDADQLEHLLDLPEGLRVSAVWADPHRMAITVGVYDEQAGTSGQQLAAVEPGTVAPHFPPDGQFARESYTVHDEATDTSKEYVRFGWEPTQAETFEQRAHRLAAQHKPLLDRLARGGDCHACVVADGHGCEAHREEGH